MILVLYGADELGLRRRLQQLKDEADGGTGMLTTNLTIVDGRDAKPGDILAPAMAPPFLAPKRLVIVEGLLDRYEQSREQRQSRSLDLLAPLFAALEAGLPESSILVFTGGAPQRNAARGRPRRNALLDRFKQMKTKVQVEEFPELKGEALMRHIREEAAARGIRFKPGPSHAAAGDAASRPRESDPAVMLANLLHGDTLALAGELDKLALYTMGRDATVDDVGLVCAGERQQTVFQFTDGVFDGDLPKAFEALAFLRDHGESHQGLISLLADGYRTSATVLDRLDDGATPEEIGTAIRRPWPGLRDAAIRRAKRFGPAGVRAACTAIVEADRTTKLGEVDEDLAFDLLVVRLASLVRR